MQKINFRDSNSYYLVLLLVFALGVIGGIVGDRAYASREIIQLVPKTTDARHTAFLVMRPADCEGNLDVLELFKRPQIKERIRLGGIIVIGTEALTADAMRSLRDRGISVTVSRADAELRRRLVQTGWRQTPLILVMDRRGTMRATLVAPQSISEYLALAGTLQAFPRPRSEGTDE
jgi:hypothetical protein